VKNIEMMKRIKAVWDNTPERFDMGTWETPEGSYIEEIKEGYLDPDTTIEFFNPETDDHDIEVRADECGTTRCMAGWAIYFNAIDKGLDPNQPLELLLYKAHGTHYNYKTAGAEILGLTEGESGVFLESSSYAYGQLAEWIEEGGING